MKKELRIFLTSVMFYTRIPCPRWVDHSPDYLQQSARYLPLIGILVGAIGAAVFFVSSLFLPQAMAILISMIVTMLVTGALHEDGLSDVCDGFGAGWTKEDILRIMKDSRVGIYGVLGVVVILALKFMSLYYLIPSWVAFALIAGHALSRFAAVTLLYTHPYVRPDAQSKVKSAAQKISFGSLAIAVVFGIAPLFFFQNKYVFLLLIPVFAVRWYLGYLFKKRIGGQTGDCAGATQQICEVVFYMSLLVLWKFT